MTSRRRVLRDGFGVLRQAVKEEPRMFACGAGFSALYGTMTVLSALVLGRVTDELIVPALREGATTAGALALAFTAIVAVAVLRSIGVAGRRFYSGMLQFRLQATLRRRVTRKYLHLPLAWHARHPTGQLLSNAYSDVEATWFVVGPLPMAMSVVVMLTFALVAMFATDPTLAMVGVLIFPVIIAVNMVYQRHLSPVVVRAQQLRAGVSEVAHESFDGAVVVKTLGREEDETARFRTMAEALRDEQIEVGRIRGVFDALLEALPSFGVLAVLLLGTVRVESGDLQPGQVVQVAYLFTLIATPIRAIGGVLGEFPRAVVGWDRVQNVLTAGGGLDYGHRTLPADGTAARIDVAHVSHSHAGQPVLQDVTFTVEAGRTLAIVGPTGSGKSTLITLLVRLVDPCSGEVFLDRVDLREVSEGVVAEAVAVVPQQTFLFDDTVRDNVSLGTDVDDEQVWSALRLAQADQFVRLLPDGLETRLGERGVSLSGGQRQRLALARAVIRTPRVLVLDDATSSVDPKVESAILTGLRTSSSVSTVVVVAYRKATIALADEVVYVEAGRVVARGTHQDLLADTPGYQRLVTAYGQRTDDQASGPAGEDAA